jgi:ribosome maturation factor RimP
VGLLAPCLERAGFDLEDVTVRRAGARTVVQVVVDRDAGVDLDGVAEASRLVSAELDAGGGPVAGPYVLEVSSPGVDRPLTSPRHWARAVGRLVSVQTRDGRRVLGRLRDASDDAAELVEAPSGGRGRRAPSGGRGDGAGGEPGAAPEPGVARVRYADVARAIVQVEFGSRGEDADGDEETDR